jgi:hypothetical protein
LAGDLQIRPGVCDEGQAARPSRPPRPTS